MIPDHLRARWNNLSPADKKRVKTEAKLSQKENASQPQSQSQSSQPRPSRSDKILSQSSNVSNSQKTLSQQLSQPCSAPQSALRKAVAAVPRLVRPKKSAAVSEQKHKEKKKDSSPAKNTAAAAMPPPSEASLSQSLAILRNRARENTALYDDSTRINSTDSSFDDDVFDASQDLDGVVPGL